MIARSTFTFCLLFCCCFLFSQRHKEELFGYYSAPGGESIFKFYKQGDKYFAKAVWMKRPYRLDELNPDVTKRTKKILGSILLWDFVYDGKNTWTKGHIYDANNGKIYKAQIVRDKKGNMAIRGFVGVKLIGKTEYFVKVDFKE